MVSSRSEVTQHILCEKVRRNLKWNDVAAAIACSKEWATAACLGQMKLEKADAEKIGQLFGLNDEEIAWLQIAPHKGSNSIPSDPLLYRFYEVVKRFRFLITKLSKPQNYTSILKKQRYFENSHRCNRCHRFFKDKNYEDR